MKQYICITKVRATKAFKVEDKIYLPGELMPRSINRQEGYKITEESAAGSITYFIEEDIFKSKYRPIDEDDDTFDIDTSNKDARVTIRMTVSVKDKLLEKAAVLDTTISKLLRKYLTKLSKTDIKAENVIDSSHSNPFSLRVARTLRSWVTKEAISEGISTNQFICTILAEEKGRRTES